MDLKMKRCGALINRSQVQRRRGTKLEYLSCVQLPFGFLLIRFPKIDLPSSHIQAPFIDDYLLSTRLVINTSHSKIFV